MHYREGVQQNEALWRGVLGWSFLNEVHGSEKKLVTLLLRTAPLW